MWQSSLRTPSHRSCAPSGSPLLCQAWHHELRLENWGLRAPKPPRGLGGYGITSWGALPPNCSGMGAEPGQDFALSTLHLAQPDFAHPHSSNLAFNKIFPASLYLPGSPFNLIERVVNKANSLTPCIGSSMVLEESGHFLGRARFQILSFPWKNRISSAPLATCVCIRHLPVPAHSTAGGGMGLVPCRKVYFQNPGCSGVPVVPAVRTASGHTAQPAP